MTGQWVASAYSKNSTAVEIDDSLKKDEVVILLQGKNSFGDEIFSYLKLDLMRLIELKRAMLKGENFFPSSYGTVLAAGKGQPSKELKSEMAVTHKLVDAPSKKTEKQPTPKMGSFAAKNIGNLWDPEDK